MRKERRSYPRYPRYSRKRYYTVDSDRKAGQRIANGCLLIQMLVTLCLLSMGIIIF